MCKIGRKFENNVETVLVQCVVCERRAWNCLRVFLVAIFDFDCVELSGLATKKLVISIFNFIYLSVCFD